MASEATCELHQAATSFLVQEADPAHLPLLCNNCRQKKSKNAYSSTQLKKKGKRTCTSCVEGRKKDSGESSAFERAMCLAEGEGPHPIQVRNLLIGCTTNAKCQQAVNAQWGGNHNHTMDEWVSFDADPAVKADICADVVETLKTHISSISHLVYIEHFNSGSKKIYSNPTFRICSELFSIMAPGACLKMDMYPLILYVERLMASSSSDDHANDGGDDELTWTGMDAWDCAGTVTCIMSESEKQQARTNPYWTYTTRTHFCDSLLGHNDFDDFGGREALIEFIRNVLVPHKGFAISEVDKGFIHRSDADCITYVIQFTQKAAITHEFHGLFLRSFYGKRLEPRIIRRLEEIGFVDISIDTFAINPYNERPCDRMISAHKPR